jgi:gamma-glutamyltranspeptidase / glutathione hydrolase
MRYRLVAPVALLLGLWGCASRVPDGPAPNTGRGRDGAVATVHPLATQAAVAAMERGGNAVDAAVAAALVLGVVDGHNSGIGGGCFMLIRRADGSILAIDGREMAPGAASRDMYLRNGRADPALSQTGALAGGVPGSLAAYDHAMRKAGRLTLGAHLLDAARIAEDGFAIDRAYASRLRDVGADLARFPASAAIFLDEQRRPWPQGHLLRQPDLARTYRAIAEEGIGHFYGGAFAQRLEEWMKANGGILTAQDFADYRIALREPLRSSYRGWTIIGFPPPSSGGVHVAQILNILERFDLRRLDGRDPALRLHVMVEAMKLAFADRAFWLGDPDFVDVPRELAGREYAAGLARRIDMETAAHVPGQGTPPHSTLKHFGRHTTHIATADAEGNWVALTTTVNTSFGSKVTIPGTGVILNNQMDDFSIQPGVPNAFGLVGAEANAIAPGKRPLSSMSPTIVLRDGRPVLSIGAAGGPTIISQVVLSLSNHIDLRMPLESALAAPRIHHQWRPDVLVVEDGIQPAQVERLKANGHVVVQRQRLGAAQGIAYRKGIFVAIHDPRVEGSARGVQRD